MKSKSSLKHILCSLCLLPMAALAGSFSPLPGGNSHAAGAVPGSHAVFTGEEHEARPVRWPPFRRQPVHPVSIRPLPNGGVQATMRGGCYVILDRYGRVLKENSCDKAELILATRAARDYLSRRRW